MHSLAAYRQELKDRGMDDLVERTLDYRRFRPMVILAGGGDMPEAHTWSSAGHHLGRYNKAARDPTWLHNLIEQGTLAGWIPYVAGPGALNRVIDTSAYPAIHSIVRPWTSVGRNFKTAVRKTMTDYCDLEGVSQAISVVGAWIDKDAYDAGDVVMAVTASDYWTNAERITGQFRAYEEAGSPAFSIVYVTSNGTIEHFEDKGEYEIGGRKRLSGHLGFIKPAHLRIDFLSKLLTTAYRFRGNMRNFSKQSLLRYTANPLHLPAAANFAGRVLWTFFGEEIPELQHDLVDEVIPGIMGFGKGLSITDESISHVFRTGFVKKASQATQHAAVLYTDEENWALDVDYKGQDEDLKKRFTSGASSGGGSPGAGAP